MKKVLTFVLAFVLVVALATMTVGARTLTAAEKALFEDLKSTVEVADGEFHLDYNVVAQGENWLAGNTTEVLNDSQISVIKAEFDAAQALVKAEDTGVVKNWSTETKNGVLTHIDNAAQQVGLHAVSNATAAAAVPGAAAASAGISIVDVGNNVVVTSDVLIPATGFGAEAMIIAGVSVIVLLGACVIVSKKVELF